MLKDCKLIVNVSFMSRICLHWKFINFSLFLYMFSVDHSRVLLQPIIGKPRSSDYINANYIDVSMTVDYRSSPK